MITQGRRLYFKDGFHLNEFQPGDYGKNPNGYWMCRIPDEKHNCLGSLEAHDVVEHEDGTITVSPSILITSEDETGKYSWHGYLEKGVWRTV
jgi:hypothetical protein